MQIDVQDSRISCNIKGVTITAEDSTYVEGKSHTSKLELERLKKTRQQYASELDEISASVPEMKTWKKINL